MDVLKVSTSPGWLDVALADFDAVLRTRSPRDHAHCERKAAASAMGLVVAYPEHGDLVRSMAKLAQEELRHFQQVHRLLLGRGLALGRDGGDRYAQQLLRTVRHGPDSRRTDRLLVCGLIEARSAERLGLLAGALAEAPLRKFYQGLAAAEAGHHQLFVDLAARYDDPDVVAKRLEELAALEAEIVSALPVEARIH
jgi:tRNA 2-(methylsulfanyl)-N6-isopentenyladenosine37 hydroxylase